MTKQAFKKNIGFALASLMFLSSQVHAERLLWSFNPVADNAAGSTHLLDIRQGSDLSRRVSSIRNQGFETASGDQISFDQWYSTTWTDCRILWLTHLDKTSGIIWGGSTGEYGEKYVIQPALTLGFVHQEKIAGNAILAFHVISTVWGGRLKEKTCTADYGEIGGVQQVNCRLAASMLQPAETLQYLMNERPESDFLVSVRYVQQF